MAEVLQVGSQVGGWRLLYRGGLRRRRSGGRRLWLCQCQCLTIREVIEVNLKMRKMNMKGHPMQYLAVLSTQEA